MKERIIEVAKKCGADIVKFAPAGRFDKNDALFTIMPNVKTVIALAFRVLRGTYRGIEEGSTYYQYTTMAVENMEETVMPMAALRVSTLIEAEGFSALAQRRHQQIMKGKDSTNPEVAYDAIYRGREAENQLDFENTAVVCGIGERGKNGSVLCDEFGPMVRYCFILTDAEITPDKPFVPHICDNCGECIKMCPGKAISEKGELDIWRCAVYYNGANGIKNPFMPPDAFAKFKDRLEIISGEADITPERAREIIDNIYFYPPAQHAYTASICGRACDMACYIHLEEKGVLKRSFKTQFRRRKVWEFDLEDYK